LSFSFILLVGFACSFAFSLSGIRDQTTQWIFFEADFPRRCEAWSRVSSLFGFSFFLFSFLFLLGDIEMDLGRHVLQI